jgi:hypothetical protein
LSISLALAFAFIFNGAAWIICAVFLIFMKRVPMYHPVFIFLIYFLFGYVYRPFADLIAGGHAPIWSITGLNPNANDVIYAAVVSIVGLVSFVFLPPLISPKVYDGLGISRSSIQVGKPIPFYLTLAISAILGSFALKNTYWNADSESLVAFVVRVQQSGGQALEGISGYETMSVQFLPAVIILLYLRFGGKAWLLAVTAMYFSLRVYFGTERAGFILLVFGLLIAHMIRSGIKAFKLKHLAAAVLVLFLFDFIGGNRYAIRSIFSGTTTVDEAVSDYVNDRGAGMPLSDLEEFESTTMVTMVVPELAGYNWFTQYLRLLIWPIPRQWWPEKPVFTERIVWIEHGNFFAQTHSMIGDAYSNLGIFSLVPMMGLYGFGLSLLYRTAQRKRSPFWIVLFLMVSMNLPLLYRDGEVGAYYFMIVSTLGVLPALWLGRPILVRRDVVDTKGCS